MRRRMGEGYLCGPPRARYGKASCTPSFGSAQENLSDVSLNNSFDESTEKILRGQECVVADLELSADLQAIADATQAETQLHDSLLSARPVPMAVPFQYDNVLFANGVRRRVKLTKTVLGATVWQAKHNVSDEAMADLKEISNASWWRPSELRSGKTLRRKRECLPLLPLFTKKLKETTPTAITDDGEWDLTKPRFFYFHSVCDIISQHLKTPGVLESMTFGARYGSMCKEQWHGRQTRESPLFTFDQVTLTKGVFNLGDTILCRGVGPSHAPSVYLLSGISRHEVSGELMCFLRRYAFDQGGRRRRGTQLDLILTEQEDITTLEALDDRLLRPVRVAHEPSVRAHTGLAPSCRVPG
jgi:hypothetical protein